MATQAQITAVQQLYVSYLGRAADKAGLDFWSNAIATGTATIASVATGLTLATEYTSKYAGLTTDALVDAVYTNVLGRTADAAGKAFWVASFANGTVKADTFVSSLIQSLGTQDQATINNKTFVAQTYTDTVGDAYTPAGGAAVLVGVDSTAASVNAALANIAAGTVTGQVPAGTQIAAVVAAQADIVALEKAIAASNPKLDTSAPKDGLVTETEAQAGVTAAQNDRTAIGGTTADLKTAADDAASNLLKAKALVAASSTDVKANVAAYDAAVAAQKVLVGTTVGTAQVGTPASPDYDPSTTPVTGTPASPDYKPAQTAAEVAEAKATEAANTALTAVDSALSATGATTTYATLSTAFGGTISNKAQLQAALELTTSTSTANKAALVAELQKVATYGQTTIDTVAAHKAIVDANDKVDTTAGADFGTTGYVAAAQASVTTTDTLAKATAADAVVDAAKAVVAQYTALDDKLTLAQTALNTYKAANADKVVIHDDLTGQGNTNVGALTAKSDVFFVSSLNKTANNDFAIGTAASAATKFGTGDSIVLGSSYTYNSGALSTGDGNKAEFFLVQKGSDTLVVIETAAYGSSTTLHTATGDAAAVTSPDAAVITLTGVNVADLTVSNGVISHVA